MYRLNDNLFLTDIRGSDSASRTGRVRGSGARQRIGLLTRVRPLEIDIQASLTTQGDVSVRGNAEVNGNDQTPTGWAGCDPPGGAADAVRTTTGGDVVVSVGKGPRPRRMRMPNAEKNPGVMTRSWTTDRF